MYFRTNRDDGLLFYTGKSPRNAKKKSYWLSVKDTDSNTGSIYCILFVRVHKIHTCYKMCIRVNQRVYIPYIWMLELCIIYVIVSILVCLYEYVDGGLQSVVISTVFSSILHMTPHYHITIYRVDREFNICIDDVRVLVYHFY